LVVLDEEIGDAMAIETISWQRGPSGSAVASFNGFQIFMGISEADMLGTTFDDNYIPGTRTLVYETNLLELNVGPDEWFDFTLDTPFWYNGEDNLIIEVVWQSGENTLWAYVWNTTGQTPRSVEAATAGASQGFLSQKLSELRLDGILGLTQETFGGIKALF